VSGLVFKAIGLIPCIIDGDQVALAVLFIADQRVCPACCVGQCELAELAGEETALHWMTRPVGASLRISTKRVRTSFFVAFKLPGVAALVCQTVQGQGERPGKQLLDWQRLAWKCRDVPWCLLNC